MLFSLLFLLMLKEFLHGIELIQECSPRSKDLIMSFGERMSCLIVSSYLQELGQNVLYVDTRDVIKTDSHYNNASVDFKISDKLIHKKLHAFRGISVITGFIASDSKGITTTIGRNGSDYTASIIGAALNATEIEIWTDVDGVLSADPRIVRNAFVIPELSIEEAQELAYFGAKVIHPYSLVPVIEKSIPVHIKNTLNPAAPGSIIKKTVSKTSELPITGIASIENVSIINIEGSGMVGLPGIASKIFSSLARAGINIIMISQASSEHSICIVCRTNQVKEAKAALTADLNEELFYRKIQKIGITDNLEIIAVIGENMRGTPGLSGKLFSSLGSRNINVLAIAQGSSERNISLVIKAEDSREAINTIHNTFLKV